MEVTERKIKVKDLVKDYRSEINGGTFGYSGKLNIRPAYQREFVYNEKQQRAVIDTVLKGYPLNIMYWSDNENDTFEVIDGQQRTLSICNYVSGGVSFDNKFFFNQPDDIKEIILNYELTIYICKGEDSERLEWFKIINIAGEKLTKQELRNAVYSGSWLSDAKKDFSKTGCRAHQLGINFLKGSSIRQEYLETVLGWISNGNIENYMATHQHDANASQLWRYFNDVINWWNATFSTYRKEMKGLPIGLLYNDYKDKIYNADDLESEIAALMKDEDVTKKSGVYLYILTRDEKYLSIRTFSPAQKREAYEASNGICPICGKEFKLNEMEADHITPWSQGGKTSSDNCQMLCRNCNRTKSNK